METCYNNLLFYLFPRPIFVPRFWRPTPSRCTRSSPGSRRWNWYRDNLKKGTLRFIQMFNFSLCVKQLRKDFSQLTIFNWIEWLGLIVWYSHTPNRNDFLNFDSYKVVIVFYFKAVFLNRRVSAHFWVAGTHFGSPNSILFRFVGRQQPVVENHCFKS